MNERQPTEHHSHDCLSAVSWEIKFIIDLIGKVGLEVEILDHTAHLHGQRHSLLCITHLSNALCVYWT